MGHILFFFDKTRPVTCATIRSHVTLMRGRNVTLGSYVMFSHHNVTGMMSFVTSYGMCSRVYKGPGTVPWGGDLLVQPPLGKEVHVHT